MGDYPGVYVNEASFTLPPTIKAVSTSHTAFIGVLSNGPYNEEVLVTSYVGFQTAFGVQEPSPLNYAIQLFFINGGSNAIILRVEDKNDLVNQSNTNVGLLAIQAKFNLLVMPDLVQLNHEDYSSYVKLILQYCEEHNIFFIAGAFHTPL
ncbi:MAG: hypothetical protein AAGK97_14565 [Bacteroidota bacterium]